MKKALRQISLPNLIRQVSSLQKHDKNGKLYIYIFTIEIETKLYSDRLYIISTFFI